jgi:hypothetical protein
LYVCGGLRGRDGLLILTKQFERHNDEGKEGKDERDRIEEERD